MSQVSLCIPESDIAKIEAAIQTLHDKLMPHLHTLSPKERKELPQMGEKTCGFVQNSVEHPAKTRNPGFDDVDSLMHDVAPLLRDEDSPECDVDSKLCDEDSF